MDADRVKELVETLNRCEAEYTAAREELQQILGYLMSPVAVAGTKGSTDGPWRTHLRSAVPPPSPPPPPRRPGRPAHVEPAIGRDTKNHEILWIIWRLAEHATLHAVSRDLPYPDEPDLSFDRRQKRATSILGGLRRAGFVESPAKRGGPWLLTKDGEKALLELQGAPASLETGGA